jgi:hypothetical protein
MKPTLVLEWKQKVVECCHQNNYPVTASPLFLELKRMVIETDWSEFPDDKFNRWSGYTDCLFVALGIVTLEVIRQKTRLNIQLELCKHDHKTDQTWCPPCDDLKDRILYVDLHELKRAKTDNEHVFKEYCKLIATKFQEHDILPEFLDHFARHMSEMIAICLSGTVPHKSKLRSLINFAFIGIAMLDEDLTFLECIATMNAYHQRPGVSSVNQAGEFKLATQTEVPGRKYQKREYCKAECPIQLLLNAVGSIVNIKQEVCQTRCVKSAWEFHDWLQQNSFRIIKEDEKNTV